MATYLRTLKSLADSLAAINSHVSHKNLVIYALVGLPSEYESFITTVTNNNTVLSFNDLRTKLLYQEQRLHHLHGASHHDTAFVATNSGPGHDFVGRSKGRGGLTSTPKCLLSRSYDETNRFFAGQPAPRGFDIHLLRPSFGSPGSNIVHNGCGRGLLPTPSAGVRASSSTLMRSSLICQICSKVGHSALACYNRFNHSYASDDLPRSFSAMAVAETSDTQWYPDSGASAYMTPNDGMLFNSSPYTVSIVSQFMHYAHTTHLQAVKRIFRYLKGTLIHDLLLRLISHLSLVAYADADWARCPDSRRSTSGNALFLGSNVISWHAKKQPTVSQSSAESEYRSVAYAVAESYWLRQLLRDLDVFLPQPVVVYCDNVSATYLAKHPVFHARTKHIEIDFHFVREKVANSISV
ncbi:hypothetical protein RJ640_020469 [Escallonia rubra]|uniref:Uncharacterized protein n=1 Tax=Escallonia rubra TaxID=112253 RepID=A0AA88R415_9ASTE|nr:hypothetical protein RJ640_020469 [Escallonia rubra]